MPEVTDAMLDDLIRQSAQWVTPRAHRIHLLLVELRAYRKKAEEQARDEDVGI